MRSAGLLGLVTLAVLAVFGEAATWWGDSERDTACTRMELFCGSKRIKLRRRKKDPFQECLFLRKCSSFNAPASAPEGFKAWRALLTLDERYVCVCARGCTYPSYRVQTDVFLDDLCTQLKCVANPIPSIFPPDLHGRFPAFIVRLPPS